MKAARYWVAQCLRFLVIVLTNVGLAWTILGCAPGVVHVVSAETSAFQELLNAEMTAGAVRPAHGMASWVLLAVGGGVERRRR